MAILTERARRQPVEGEVADWLEWLGGLLGSVEVGGGEVVVVGGDVVDVVVVVGGGGDVVDVVVVVVVVVGGTVVEVVDVVVVVGAVLPFPTVAVVPIDAGNVHSAAAQSVGWDATATSTPGSVLNVQTARGGPVWRHARAGALVVKLVNVPRYCATPADGGPITGVSGAVAPFQTPELVNPDPGGVRDDPALTLVGPVCRSFTAGARPSRAASMAGLLPSMPKAQIPKPAMWKELANCAFMAREVGSSKNV